MAVQLHIPGMLAPLAGGGRSIAAQGATVGEVVADVAARHPALAGKLRDERGEPYPYVLFYLNDGDIRLAQGFGTPVRDGDEIVVVPALSGG
ncbi:MAG TPA: MoaD/ThiS family protein [Anaeromyxobacteraceae bacterium]|nr:MoaD/ThiS family protein [Anaeromyxobacteraceae bacterium]